jgi:hypothetical protein
MKQRPSTRSDATSATSGPIFGKHHGGPRNVDLSRDIDLLACLLLTAKLRCPRSPPLRFELAPPLHPPTSSSGPSPRHQVSTLPHRRFSGRNRDATPWLARAGRRGRDGRERKRAPLPTLPPSFPIKRRSELPCATSVSWVGIVPVQCHLLHHAVLRDRVSAPHQTRLVQELRMSERCRGEHQRQPVPHGRRCLLSEKQHCYCELPPHDPNVMHPLLPRCLIKCHNLSPCIYLWVCMMLAAIT